MKSLISKEEIFQKIQETAEKLNRDYLNKDLVIVMVLKGAICLVADLIRALDVPFELETLQCASYGALGKERGKLKVIGADLLNLKGKDVLVVDDIFDSGTTMVTLIETLKKLNPLSIKSCVLLNKEGVTKTTNYLPDYILFTIENLFVVGYGLDYKEKYRGLSSIFVLNEEI